MGAKLSLKVGDRSTVRGIYILVPMVHFRGVFLPTFRGRFYGWGVTDF